MLFALIKTLRPQQWVKNLFVAAPLFFSLRLFDTVSLLRSAAAVALFCLISGCVYVLNDIVDVEQDRRHPQKRNRPIASGKLSISVARTFLVLAVPGCIATAFALAPMYAAVLSTYFVLNIAYSFKLKNISYLDVLSIATFFILRVLAGAFAIGVEASPWLLGCTFLLATFLGFGKRAHELAGSSEAEQQRSVLAHYRLPTLRAILYLLAGLVVVVYALYTRSEHTVALFGTDMLIWTVPFPVIGILRFSHLAVTRHDAESPTEEMLRDPLFVANFVAYVIATFAILYWLPS
ncbi:MAG: decaprenyl-phosphate phosphoribosyltransferase [Deltaproteobacteria bacterium]|nr:decaprenyl-phosphate phosphoribosyltransferase [Nannocystaceae bacterium]